MGTSKPIQLHRLILFVKITSRETFHLRLLPLRRRFFQTEEKEIKLRNMDVKRRPMSWVLRWVPRKRWRLRMTKMKSLQAALKSFHLVNQKFSIKEEKVEKLRDFDISD